ncbi:AraC family transcriptional regulator [Dyadobacter pollutisoli]|uniref:AraC family transcriptional regulator n=2 Tax=Dyadobacter pollutisoli TaxID=2910158 RepID=A0A9E8SN48_9BACT|nr:AraC family transcriptional regulator [Dyadobacter pollutisoli]
MHERHHLVLVVCLNMLKGSNLNINEISFLLGFDDPNYFSRLFKRNVGLTPHVFREQSLN